MKMDKKKAIDLIKVQVLGCIETEDLAELKSAMENNEDFPMKELGEYQNLAALIPSGLQIELPSPQLKDKVARKLYRLRDEIKAQKLKETAIETETAVTEEEAPLLETDDTENIDVKIDEPELNKQPDISEPEVEAIVESRGQEVEARFKESIDDEKVEKKIKQYIATYYEAELGELKKSGKRNFIINLILSIIALAAAAFAVFQNFG